MGNNLIVIFVDFSQAFDRINRNILFHKLKLNRLSGRLVDVLHSLYSKTSFRVKHGGKISDRIKESCGVNQGGNASPFLFRKYLQDLIDYLDAFTGVHISSHTLLNRAWADDVFLVSTNNAHAQIQINGLSKFCTPNQMIVNDIKTKVMLYAKDIEIDIKLNGKTLEVVKQYKCLGTIVNSIKTFRGNVFRYHADYACQQARKAAFDILNKIKQVGEIPPKHLFYLYQSMVQPILVFGSENWGIDTKSCQMVDKLFNWFARLVLRVKSTTCNIMTLGECGVIPPSIFCHINAIIYAIRLKNISQDSILRGVFTENVYLHEIGFETWYSKVTKLAKTYNINLDDFHYSEKTKKCIKSKVKHLFVLKWKENIFDLNKYPILRIYRTIHTE